MRRGIIAGGNWIIDHIKTINVYPLKEELALILHENSSNGGSAYNVLKNLSKLGADFPLEAIGMIGDDENGKLILEDCKKHKLETSRLLKTTQSGTSFTDVMSEQETGKRTFFHNRGANDYLSEWHFDFSVSNCRIFHLGYLLMLRELDAIDANGNSGASNVLRKAKESGFKTSADLVSVRCEDFKRIVQPSLKFIDYFFLNEIEANLLTGVEIKEDGRILIENCFTCAALILEQGVKEWVFLHFDGGVVAVNKGGEKIFQSSLNIPRSMIKGTVGAGDAFAAGILFGMHEGFPIEKTLKLGVSSAASCLFKPTCSDGIISYTECFSLIEQFGIKEYLIVKKQNE